jgi:hypothetical protein
MYVEREREREKERGIRKELEAVLVAEAALVVEKLKSTKVCSYRIRGILGYITTYTQLRNAILLQKIVVYNIHIS